MNKIDLTINQSLDLESHELEELTLLFKISQTANPEIYEAIREPLNKLITDTIEHMLKLLSYAGALRRVK